jgi:hypothetical protein
VGKKHPRTQAWCGIHDEIERKRVAELELTFSAKAHLAAKTPVKTIPPTISGLYWPCEGARRAPMQHVVIFGNSRSGAVGIVHLARE